MKIKPFCQTTQIQQFSHMMSCFLFQQSSQQGRGPLWFESLCAKLFLETTDLHLRQLRIVYLYQTIHSFQLWHCMGINFDKVLSCSNLKSKLLPIMHSFLVDICISITFLVPRSNLTLFDNGYVFCFMMSNTSPFLFIFQVSYLTLILSCLIHSWTCAKSYVI